MARRGENIRKRKDGRWEGRYTIYKVGQNGTVRSVYARTYAEVKEKLAKAKCLPASGYTGRGKQDAAGVTFLLASEEWLDTIHKSRKLSTYQKYKMVYEKHLLGKLGTWPVAQLDADLIREILETDEFHAYSVSLQRSVYCVLNQILTYASTHYPSGTARYVYRRQHVDAKPLKILNHTEQIKLLRYLYEEMDIYKLGIIICISTGLRLGEICALKWQDIDMEGKLLHVNATVQRIAMDGMPTKTILWEGEPKSIFSKRELPLSSEIISLLRPYYGSGRYVIGRNYPVEPRTYQNRFSRYLQEAGIEKKNFHILRHTFATNCVAGGVDAKSLSEILGHSDVKITLNRYVHPSMETKRQHLDSLSAIYGQYLGHGCP